MIKFGTNRIVIVGRKWVYKLPIFSRGKAANLNEYANYTKHDDIVAKTYKKWYGLKQERLHDIKVYRYQAAVEEILPEHIEIFKQHFTHNRLQIGKSKDGQWKMFDAEDVKYYENTNSRSSR